MKLVVDIGNTRTKWARIEENLMPGQSFLRDRGLDVEFDEAWSQLRHPEAVLISSVAEDDYEDKVSAWMRHRWHLQPDWFRSQRIIGGISSVYDDPGQLGSDRLAALLGARHLYSGTLGVIDCGSAITLDVLDHQDQHLGGYILPGAQWAQDWLLSQTARVRAELNPPTTELGTNTAACVSNGVYLGYGGALEHLMQHINHQTAQTIQWVATGGAWPSIRSFVPSSDKVLEQPDLVLIGLAHALDLVI